LKHTSMEAGPIEGPRVPCDPFVHRLVRVSLGLHQKCTWAVGLHWVSLPLCTLAPGGALVCFWPIAARDAMVGM